MTYRLKDESPVLVATSPDASALSGARPGAEPWLPPTGASRLIFVAAVLGADGPLFTAVAESEEQCRRQVATYVSDRVDLRLWPWHAARVRALLEEGDHAAAASLYFEHVGERWDEEWLVTSRVDRHVTVRDPEARPAGTDGENPAAGSTEPRREEEGA